MDVSISIIIPVYNVEKYIAECIDSVLNQTVSFDEIILINDGSTDMSGDICRDYQKENPQIRLIEQKNSGQSAARNRGMETAAGDYIVFLDSDDLADSRMCERIKDIIRKNGLLDVVYYAADIIKEIPTTFSEEGYSRNEEMAGIIIEGFSSMQSLFPEYYEMSACMSAYRRSFLQRNKIAFIEGILYEDRFFSLRTITEAESVMYITDKLYIRRFRANSTITSPASRKKIENVICGHNAEWNYISNNQLWKSDKGLTQYYVLYAFYMAFHDSVSSVNEEYERSRYLEAFLNTWFDYFDIDIMSLNELALLSYVLDKVNKDTTKDIFLLYSKMVEKFLIAKCKKKLEILPLQERERVGIYGVGRHTECMLNLYRAMFGEINADLYYIVSNKIEQDTYDGREIRHLESLYQDTAHIIISSKVYQKEMCKKLETVQFDSNKVIKLYSTKDAIDFVMIYDLFSNIYLQ